MNYKIPKPLIPSPDSSENPFLFWLKEKIAAIAGLLLIIFYGLASSEKSKKTFNIILRRF